MCEKDGKHFWKRLQHQGIAKKGVKINNGEIHSGKNNVHELINWNDW